MSSGPAAGCPAATGSGKQDTGYSVDGCYAEYFVAEAAFVTPVPAGAGQPTIRLANLGSPHFSRYDRGMLVSVNVQTVQPRKLAAVRRLVAPGEVGSARGPVVHLLKQASAEGRLQR